MKNHRLPCAVLLAFSVALLVGVGPAWGPAWGAVMSNNSSGVKVFFSSQSDTFYASNPPGAVFGPAGNPGPTGYPSGTNIPSLPAAPPASISPPGGLAFSGGGLNSPFNDGIATTALSVISDSFPAAPVLTSDARIAIPTWNLTQGVSATGYAYNQMNFGSNYLVTNNLTGLGASTPNVPIFVSGSVITGPNAFAKFDGQINYTWLPVALDAAGNITGPAGPAVPLGTLSYTYFQASGGIFSSTLFSSGTLLATPIGNGILALDGQMWIAGDPFSLKVSTVPEPASVALMSLGVVRCLGRRKRGIAG